MAGRRLVTSPDLVRRLDDEPEFRDFVIDRDRITEMIAGKAA